MVNYETTHRRTSCAILPKQGLEKMDAKTLAFFQLEQRLLCVPFDIFHQSVEETLKRPVFTHEFVDMASLLDEAKGLTKVPSIEEIIAMLPQEKTIIIAT